MIRNSTNDHEEFGFTANPMKSRRTITAKISDLNFVDDITLLSDDLSTAEELLLRWEAECGRTSIHLYAKKTECMAFNVNSQGPLMTSNSHPSNQFKYLGSRMKSTSKGGKHQHGGPSTT